MSMLYQLIRATIEKSDHRRSMKASRCAEDGNRSLRLEIKRRDMRIDDLEAWLIRVLDTAIGDGREAMSPEKQMLLRTGRAVAENKLKK